ncbi:ABC transporter substrate-binding protein [Bradyrhizobium guangzhouense]|uniref:ABC transporter substrate-binding protein n=1 Tax=Bradyrhizobium guangzhouense TaxID=1325095 RepID=A0AAE5WWN9_9BRAD|nr:ABC transporter substrate-binding protein [Bradyrhizobium guangzhouense]QAU44477.1 ABC transporter substrate-binding protein [Bradyrhizobium guangzhouense]RXH06003.1 ABC transporter substrate-binding protein [Bradyrhizobium guangzhouense]
MRRREFVALSASCLVWGALANSAQARRPPTVGVLWHAGAPSEEEPYYSALLQGFRDEGYIDGDTIKLEQRFPSESPERFRSFAAELIALQPDVLVGVGSLSTPYLAEATKTIPIVFTIVADPVAMKLVDSLAAPGRNATGFSNYSGDLMGKRLEVLRRALPDLKHVGMLFNPDDHLSSRYLAQAISAAQTLQLDLTQMPVRLPDEFKPTFSDAVGKGVQAVAVAGDGFMFRNRAAIARQCVERRLPVFGWSHETADAGFFASYGTDQRDLVRKAAGYVGRILRGARPADLPVEQPTKFELVLNLKTAKALGVTIPDALLHLADDVIE